MVDSVVIPPTSHVAPEGHDEKMAALGSAAVDGGVPAVPAIEPAADGKIPDVPTPDEPKAEEEAPAADADDALKGTGLELATFENEFAETGALSTESYEALEKAGIPKAVVDQYIEGQKAIAANQTAEAHALVGGADNYKSMVSWAANTLGADEKAAFNSAVDKGGADAKLAIAGLNAQFRATQGSNPSLLNGFAPAGGDAVVGYRSTAELTTAMSDPRYAKDPAYRKDVEAKLAASKLF
jgi:hypothetical protein